MRRVFFATTVVALVIGAAVSAFAAGDNFTADKHLKAGLTCKDCHGPDKPAPVPTEKCLSCHGSYEALAKRTAGLPRNPHNSHLGDLDCSECHHGHKADDYVCGDCHGGH